MHLMSLVSVTCSYLRALQHQQICFVPEAAMGFLAADKSPHPEVGKCTFVYTYTAFLRPTYLNGFRHPAVKDTHCAQRGRAKHLFHYEKGWRTVVEKILV